MDILTVLSQVRSLLRQEGRISYRLLKRQFLLDDETLEDLKFELIDIQGLAADKDGKMLVWAGASPIPSSKPVLSLVEGFQVPSQDSQLRTPNSELSPVSYTPPHLAERIRAATLTDGERKTITALFADLKGSTA